MTTDTEIEDNRSYSDVAKGVSGSVGNANSALNENPRSRIPVLVSNRHDDKNNSNPTWGWSGGAKVLGKLPVPGRPTILITVGQGPTALAVGAGGGCDIFTLIYPFSSLSPSLWETARYRLKYCLKGPLNPKQPTNQIKPNKSAYSA